MSELTWTLAWWLAITQVAAFSSHEVTILTGPVSIPAMPDIGHPNSSHGHLSLLPLPVLVNLSNILKWKGSPVGEFTITGYSRGCQHDSLLCSQCWKIHQCCNLFISVWFGTSSVLNDFTHTLQGCFTDNGTIVQVHVKNPEGYG